MRLEKPASELSKYNSRDFSTTTPQFIVSFSISVFSRPTSVIPAKAGIQTFYIKRLFSRLCLNQHGFPLFRRLPEAVRLRRKAHPPDPPQADARITKNA